MGAGAFAYLLFKHFGAVNGDHKINIKNSKDYPKKKKKKEQFPGEKWTKWVASLTI
jgi:hypothetical protein